MLTARPHLPDLALIMPEYAIDTVSPFPSQSSHIKSALADLVSVYKLDPVHWDKLNQSDMVMPLDFGNFVNHFVSPHTKVQKIQRVLSKEINNVIVAAMFKDLVLAPQSEDEIGPAWLQYRREFHIQKPDANRWATALPTTRDLRLSNMEYHIATQHNFGLSPFSTNPLQRAVCQNPGCAVDLHLDPEQPFACIHERKRGRNRQHNNVQTILERFIRACGGRV
jgi:hypothetical protein